MTSIAIPSPSIIKSYQTDFYVMMMTYNQSDNSLTNGDLSAPGAIPWFAVFALSEPCRPKIVIQKESHDHGTSCFASPDGENWVRCYFIKEISITKAKVTDKQFVKVLQAMAVKFSTGHGPDYTVTTHRHMKTKAVISMTVS